MIKQYFTDIITAGEVGVSKPNKKLFNRACDRVNKEPRECYYIGDDLHPCKDAGMNGIWLNRKFETLIIYSIDIIYNMIDLKNILQLKYLCLYCK
ncbi:MULTISPECIES: HAD family hydrolase [unclassified Clostridium]|uniref:HAD family hydrolase n=1 Tax=unclassified Clostridium TaxID=2614128 RepID=UPI000297F684|nr:MULTISPECIES: HAD family hydrolase [unclassified Clostridium]EKQ53608.1 MAG: haloacid dehalogenase superfamily enzyme, subfamily IA [Clostridium sp. Maddingley MBC34-26]